MSVSPSIHFTFQLYISNYSQILCFNCEMMTWVKILIFVSFPFQQQLEEQAAQPPEEKQTAASVPHTETKHQSIAQIIYTENRVSSGHSQGIILGMGSANGRWRYIVTSSRIGWAHTQNDHWATMFHDVMTWRHFPHYRSFVKGFSSQRASNVSCMQKYLYSTDYYHTSTF